jgi:hypothetical protein
VWDRAGRNGGGVESERLVRRAELCVGEQRGLRRLSLGIAIVSAAAAAPVDFGDNSYELVVVENPYAGTNNSWDTARDNAASRSYRGIAGHLVTITSAEENQWVASLSNETGVAAVWLGWRDGNGWLVGPEAGQSFVFTAWGNSPGFR